jgi:muramoyltetrapeptide carboxypeptidase
VTAARPSLIRPGVLQKGDTIGIVAPAGPVNREKFEAGIARLRELGFNPVFSESIFNRDLFFAGGVRRRVDELHEMFRLPEVRAIICARGGYGSNHLLPHLNLGLIAQNPKIFCGYSDITTLLTHLHDTIGLVGFHGPMLSKDFANPEGVHFGSLSNAITGQQHWTITRSDSPPLVPLTTGTAEGTLYGGCLSLLVASIGTPYEIQTPDTILLLEDLGEWPYRIDRMLMHLRYAGKLEKVRGIVFGEMIECAPSPDSDYTLQEAIGRNLADLKVPIAFGLRSGHVSAGNITLPMGVKTRLTVGETVSLEILEAATVGRAESSSGVARS